MGDGAHLILDEKGTAGIEEVRRAFLSSLGVEPALVPSGWISNHYRWLVWKLAATECSFPQQFAARYYHIQRVPEKTDGFQRHIFYILLNLQYYVSVYLICTLCHLLPSSHY